MAKKKVWKMETRAEKSFGKRCPPKKGKKAISKRRCAEYSGPIARSLGGFINGSGRW